MSEKVLSKVKAGVAVGKDVQEIFRIAKAEGFALPAVNVVGTNSINAVLEAAKAVNSPVMIQFSNGGAHFYAGKSLSNEAENAAIDGAISGAMHIHQVAGLFEGRVIPEGLEEISVRDSASSDSAVIKIHEARDAMTRHYIYAEKDGEQSSTVVATYIIRENEIPPTGNTFVKVTPASMPILPRTTENLSK